MKKLTITLIILSFFLLQEVHAQGFLRVSGKQIVNEKGENYILRGMGLGGWMLQEPYMLKLSGATGPQHDMEAKIENLIGKEAKEKFYEAWYANHLTERDIDSLAAWGFNHVRLPMHYNLYTLPIEKETVKAQNTWLDKGFQMTDSLLKWCSKNQMYLILDLHAAPGGQGKDGNISDYNPEKPSIWESDENKQKTIALWRKLAERYANEPWIGGYDLLNEPNWAFTEGAHKNGIDEKNNDDIWNLYKEITAEIRKVDKKHIIYIEGNGWANNFKSLPQAWDDNLVINFHGYWNGTDVSTIKHFLRLREEYNMPLWMSESGENSNQWFKERIQMLEENNIGWAWWPMKKIDNVVGPYSVKITEDYKTIVDYWKNGGEKPSKEFVEKALMQIAENLKSENCEYHPDVIDAMFRQRKENSAKAYKKHEIPGKILAVDFDLGENGVAYLDNDYINTSGRPNKSWNKGSKYRNDGVDIETDELTGEYYVSSFEKGEWLNFSTKVKKTKKYRIELMVSLEEESDIFIEFSDKKELIKLEALPISEGLNWVTLRTEKIELEKGNLSFKIRLEKGRISLKSIKFK